MQGNPAYLQMAVDLAVENVICGGGGPFGAVIVRGEEMIATGVNQVTATHDPTAHAEVVAIRGACRRLGDFQLTGCHLYTSCEPCPMCLSAIYWARCEAIFYGCTARDAADAGFDDAFLYEEMKRPHAERTIPTTRLLGPHSIATFDAWRNLAGRINY